MHRKINNAFPFNKYLKRSHTASNPHTQFYDLVPKPVRLVSNKISIKIA